MYQTTATRNLVNSKKDKSKIIKTHTYSPRFFILHSLKIKINLISQRQRTKAYAIYMGRLQRGVARLLSKTVRPKKKDQNDMLMFKSKILPT